MASLIKSTYGSMAMLSNDTQSGVDSLQNTHVKHSLCYVLFFMACLFPFSINIGGDGLSANYIYISFPIIAALYKGRIRLPEKKVANIMLVYFVILMLALVYQFSYLEYFARRLISFVIFMSIFVYMFVEVNERMMASFKVAVIMISVAFSLRALFMYFSLGGAALGFDGKNIVGSQRFGFVYLLAIWLLLMLPTMGSLRQILKYSGLLICIAGLLLTFSRSGIVALLGSLFFYSACKAMTWLRRPTKLKIKTIYRLAFVSLIFMIIGLILWQYLYVTFDFYASRLFSLTDANGENVYDLVNPEASEGYRIVMIQKIVEFVANNPFTGSGFLGVWILFDDASGSAHNQFADVLFRTGIFGFILYLSLLYKLLGFLVKKEPGLFWGIIGILIYGLFHETFKESQGAFILAFLLGSMATKHRESRSG